MTAISSVGMKRSAWQTTVIFTLGFWLSASLILDSVIMPSLYATGMMSDAGFASAGYTIFWSFNRIELLCAALILTSLLAWQSSQNYLAKEGRNFTIISLVLLTIALIYTYILTPQMSALGMHLNLFESVTEAPAAMNQMHAGYWVLEALKLVGIGTLLGWCYKQHK